VPDDHHDALDAFLAQNGRGSRPRCVDGGMAAMWMVGVTRSRVTPAARLLDANRWPPVCVGDDLGVRPGLAHVRALRVNEAGSPAADRTGHWAETPPRAMVANR
jgi:hypothetical protein